jgi:putative DNA primase/helicase
VVEDMVWARSITLCVAESGVGKTFLALGISTSVGDGRAWAGRRVRQGSVVYASYEGDALGLRLRALREAGGYSLDHVYIVKASEPLSPVVVFPTRAESPSPGERALEATLRGLNERLAAAGLPPVVLLVIDTVRCSMAGNEDSSGDTAAYLRAVRRVLAAVPDAGALLLHHAGWQDGDAKRQRERGSSAWRGNVDATVYVEVAEELETGARLELRALKVRDSERPAPLHLVRRRVDLSIPRPDGMPAASCLIELDPRTKPEREAAAQAAAQAEARVVDLRVLRAIATVVPPAEVTSVRQVRTLAGVSYAAADEALTRLAAQGLLLPPDRKQRPYTVTEAGRAVLQEGGQQAA